MKFWPYFLLCAACAATGLVAGGGLAGLRVRKILAENHIGAAPAGSPVKNGNSVADSRPAPASSGSQRRARLVQLMESAVRGGRSMDEAWQASENDPAMREWLAETWMRRNPAAFIALLCRQKEAFSNGPETYRLLGAVNVFAKKDPEAVLKIASAQSRPEFRRFCTTEAIMSLMESDTRKGLRLAAAHPELRLGGMNQDLNKMKLTPADVPLLLSLPGSITGSDMLLRATKDLPAGEAFRVMGQAPGALRTPGIRKAARRWVAEDMEAALQYATSGASHSERGALLASAGEKKVEQDPRAAAAWAEENLGGYPRNQVLTKAAAKLKKTDPDAAKAISARLPDNYDSSSR